MSLEEAHHMAQLIALVTVLNGRLRSTERGATAVEYGLIIAAIAIVVGAAAILLGPAIAGLFDEVRGSL
jgi:pilus assembly protein Flp/PilA